MRWWLSNQRRSVGQASDEKRRYFRLGVDPRCCEVPHPPAVTATRRPPAAGVQGSSGHRPHRLEAFPKRQLFVSSRPPRVLPSTPPTTLQLRQQDHCEARRRPVVCNSESVRDSRPGRRCWISSAKGVTRRRLGQRLHWHQLLKVKL